MKPRTRTLAVMIAALVAAVLPVLSAQPQPHASARVTILASWVEG